MNAFRMTYLVGIQLLASLVLSFTINAATVTTCDETGLRAAIAQGGTVNFACDGTITLTNTIEVTKSVAIDGTGRQVVISGGGKVRLFQVNTGVVFSARHLTFSDGRDQGTNATSPLPAGDGRGAGFLILGGALNLVDCSLSNHVAEGGKGYPLAGPGGQAQGGAICAFGGQINLTNCLLLNNRSKGGDDYSYFDVCVPGDAFGGAIYSQGGSIAAHQTQFRSNATIGGNLLVAPPPYSSRGGDAGHAHGGALHGTSAVVVLNNCILQGNSAIGGAGGSTGYEVNSARGGALSLNAGTGQVSGTTFLANGAQGGLGDGRVASGGEGFGGAIHNVGDLQIVDSRFSENSARGGGAATPGRGLGGAISTYAGLAMNKCLLDHNKAIGGPGTQVGPFGGVTAGTDGLGGAVYTTSNLKLTNVTLFGNLAIGGPGGISRTQGASGAGEGGGIFVYGSTASLTHVTMAHNSALGGVTSSTNIGAARGGGINASNSTVAFLNSILSSNLAGSNCFGLITDAGHNISSDASCHFSAAGSWNNTDPLLGPLADNGGPTPSMALLAGSPAIDAADQAGCPDTDQRGIARPFGATCDIGAFEFSTPSTIPGRLFIERTGIGTVRGTFAGEANQTFRVEVSENLTSWSPYSTNTTAGSGGFEFFDTNSAIAEARVFRVSKP